MTALGLDEDFPETASGKPGWLMTLADLALLLVGFFVFLQASQQLDRKALARGIREGFGVHADPAPNAPATAPIAVDAGAVRGFAPGSALLDGPPDALVAWARAALRDPRVSLRLAGSVDGSPGDVDPATRSGAVLAADRARAVAVALIAAGVPADRLSLATAARPARRGVTATIAFAGDRP